MRCIANGTPGGVKLELAENGVTESYFVSYEESINVRKRTYYELLIVIGYRAQVGEAPLVE